MPIFNWFSPKSDQFERIFSTSQKKIYWYQLAHTERSVVPRPKGGFQTEVGKTGTNCIIFSIRVRDSGRQCKQFVYEFETMKCIHKIAIWPKTAWTNAAIICNKNNNVLLVFSPARVPLEFSDELLKKKKATLLPLTS